MKFLRVLTLLAGVFAVPFGIAHAQSAPPLKAKNVVLVHGAWADGSSWAEVIPLLQAAGLNVTAVQNPLTSLKDSVEATRRAFIRSTIEVIPKFTWFPPEVSSLQL